LGEKKKTPPPGKFNGGGKTFFTGKKNPPRKRVPVTPVRVKPFYREKVPGYRTPPGGEKPPPGVFYGYPVKKTPVFTREKPFFRGVKKKTPPPG